MSSEPVSDKRLEELIAEYGRIAPYVGATNTFRDMMSALTELKSLRAQQAEPPAGCAEMAREIYKIIAEEFINSGTYQWEDHHLEAEIADRLKGTPTLSIIAAKLAPLFTLLADCEPHLREVDNEYTRQFDDAVENSREEAELAVKLVAIDELLCKIASLTENTERIDASLGKGDADGGREEVESE